MGYKSNIYTPFIEVGYLHPLILTIDPNFQVDIQVEVLIVSPFGFRPIFRGKLAVSFREVPNCCWYQYRTEGSDSLPQGFNQHVLGKIHIMFHETMSFF